MRASKFPVKQQRQLLLGLVLALKINQLTQRSGQSHGCDALRMINLDAPQMALLGDTIRLTCSFKLAASDEAHDSRRRESVAPNGMPLDHGEGRAVSILAKQSRMVDGSQALGASELVADRPRRHSDVTPEPSELLYAIKWYKDDREFYQFITRNWPHRHALPMVGLDVDMDKSDNQTVVLKNVSLKTSGLFRCEVSTDAPSFVTKSIERKIFIYSLPAEGPTIQTSAPTLGLNKQNLQPGDQLELRCLSRDSKPNARLDWIINDRVNLSETIPLSSREARLFHVDTHRLIRTSRFVMSSGKTVAPKSIISRADDRSSVSLGTLTSQRRPHNDNAYEVVETQGQTFLMPIGGEDSNVSIDAHTLDQFLEATVSVLNFTVSSDLVQFLQLNASNAASTSQHNPRSPTQKAISSLGAQSARSPPSQGLAFKTRKPGADQKKARVTKQSDDGRRLPLDIRCVARVMHLTMSDEIKLRIADRQPSRSSSSLELRQQDKSIQKNSAVMLDSNRVWRYLYFCFLTGVILVRMF